MRFKKKNMKHSSDEPLLLGFSIFIFLKLRHFKELCLEKNNIYHLMLLDEKKDLTNYRFSKKKRKKKIRKRYVLGTDFSVF